VQCAADLRKIKPVAGDTGGFAGQLDVLRKLRERLGDEVLTCTTIFNAWATLRQLTAPPSDKHGPPTLDGQDERDDKISELLKEDRSAVAAAIEAIGASLSAFARECLAAGAMGIFLSVRDDWVNRRANGLNTYDKILRPVDLQILDAASAATFNVLHICGRPQNFAAFAAYPVHVINWADRAAGPSIAYARDRVKRTTAIAAGVDNLRTLPEGTPEDCAHEVRDALRQAKDRPIMIAAGCTFDPDAVPPTNLKAVVTAARQHAPP
jgi:uroporphyrinogen decarboxylase